MNYVRQPKLCPVVTPMTDPIASIEERRFALVELNSLMRHVSTVYGSDPPVDIRNALAELAKAYRNKYGNVPDKTREAEYLKEFCVKNGLPLI